MRVFDMGREAGRSRRDYIDISRETPSVRDVMREPALSELAMAALGEYLKPEERLVYRYEFPNRRV